MVPMSNDSIAVDLESDVKCSKALVEAKAEIEMALDVNNTIRLGVAFEGSQVNFRETRRVVW